MRYLVGFDGYLVVNAESKEEAEVAFWESVSSFETNYTAPVEGGLVNMLGIKEEE